MGSILYGSTAGRMGAPLNQGAGERHQMLRNGQISDRNSALPTEEPSRWKKGQPEPIVPTGLLMSGRLDSNQRPPEPHSGWRNEKGPFSRSFSRIGVSTISTLYTFTHTFARFLLPLLPFYRPHAVRCEESESQKRIGHTSVGRATFQIQF